MPNQIQAGFEFEAIFIGKQNKLIIQNNQE